MLYIATAAPISKEGRTRLSLEDVRGTEAEIRQWFSLPHVMFVGVDGSCSCGFPHILADAPVPYYDGMLDDSKDSEYREDEIVLASELISLVRECLSCAEKVELYAIWISFGITAPKGTITLTTTDLDARKFFLIEQFLYDVRA